jgi:hypothetical protein
VTALGVAVVVGAYLLNRSSSGGGVPTFVFWLGFVVTLGPALAYLSSDRPTRESRLFWVVLLGFVMYGFKILYSPNQFTMSDELVHLAAAQRVVVSQHLFGALSIKGAPIASGYPGLEAVTVAVRSLTGLSLFHSGLVIVGAARLVMMLALFVLAERITRSARAASLCALAYMANGNFMFWSAQFSYESLALPLLVAAFACLIVRAQSPKLRRGLGIVIVLVATAVAATHHLTSYLLLAVLWLTTLLAWRRQWRQYECVAIASLVTAIIAIWFFVVAPGTGDYLGYTFNRAISGVIHTLTGSGARIPFQSASGSLQTPVAARLVSFVGVAIIAVGILAEAWSGRRRWIRQPGAVVAGAAALGFVALYPLRIAPSAWETANRAQEVLFVGGAVLLGTLMVTVGRTRRLRFAVVPAMLLVISGGVISGWPTPLLLPPPLRVKADSRVILPEGLIATKWALSHLGKNATYVGDESTGRDLGVEGARASYLGSAAVVPQLLHDTTLPTWELQFLVSKGIDYLVLDRRKISADDLAGPFMPLASSPDSGRGYYPPGAPRKFLALSGVSTVFNSGDITIFDLRNLRAPLPQCRELAPETELSNVSCTASGRALTFAAAGAGVTTPAWHLKALGIDTLAVKHGTQVTVRLQLQNLYAASIAVSGRKAAILELPHARPTERLARGQFRNDNLGTTLALPRSRSETGSISFLVPAQSGVRRALKTSVLLVHVSASGLTAQARNLPPTGDWAAIPLAGLGAQK